MKAIKAFENKMREAHYASLDEARSGIRLHPLVGDYLLDLLVDRKVLRVTESGSVVGCVFTALPERADPKDKVSTEWKSTWPKRHSLISWLYAEEDEPGSEFRKLQKNLKENNEVHGHWLCLHAIWNLTKAGLVEKRHDGYRLTPLGVIEHQRYGKVDHDALTAALQQVGHPYLAAKVQAALAALPGHNWFDAGEFELGQNFVDESAKRRIKAGELPG